MLLIVLAPLRRRLRINRLFLKEGRALQIFKSTVDRRQHRPAGAETFAQKLPLHPGQHFLHIPQQPGIRSAPAIDRLFPVPHDQNMTSLPGGLFQHRFEKAELPPAGILKLVQQKMRDPPIQSEVQLFRIQPTRHLQCRRLHFPKCVTARAVRLGSTSPVILFRQSHQGRLPQPVDPDHLLPRLLGPRRKLPGKSSRNIHSVILPLVRCQFSHGTNLQQIHQAGRGGEENSQLLQTLHPMPAFGSG